MKNVVLRHLPELCIGGGAGTGIGVVVGLLTLTQPQFILLAGVGLMLGSSLGIGVGLARDELQSSNSENKEKKEPEKNPVSLIAAVNPALTVAPQPIQSHWYSKLGIFKKREHGNPVSQSDIMGVGQNPR